MDTIKKLHSLQNPYKDSDIINNREIRIDVLKSLAKLYWLELKTQKRASTKVHNIFLDDQELINLINIENLKPKEIIKIHNHILKDFWKLQKDLDLSIKSKEKSKNFFRNSIIKSKKVVCRLDKMFKPNLQSDLVIWKKTSLFCQKNKFKLLVWWTIILLSWIATLAPIQKTIEVEWQETKVISPITIYADIKLENNLLKSYSDQILNISFEQLNLIDPISPNFTKTKDLYLTFMNEISKKVDKYWNIQLNNNELNALLKMEYMYNIWVKKNLDNNLKNYDDVEQLKTIRKINTIDNQINILKSSYNKFNDWINLEVTYLKHWIEINISTINWNIVNWLTKFKY